MTNTLLIAGLICIAAGVAMWSIPAALIVTGAELIGLAWLIEKERASHVVIK